MQGQALLSAKVPEVLWGGFAGMRDILIYQYFGVSLNMVWQTATQKIPEFREKISLILSDLESGASS